MEITDITATKVSDEPWGEFVEFPLVAVASRYDEYDDAEGDNLGPAGSGRGRSAT